VGVHNHHLEKKMRVRASKNFRYGQKSGFNTRRGKKRKKKKGLGEGEGEGGR